MGYSRPFNANHPSQTLSSSFSNDTDGTPAASQTAGIKYCFPECVKSSTKGMICCDRCDQWFHFQCVEVGNLPKLTLPKLTSNVRHNETLDDLQAGEVSGEVLLQCLLQTTHVRHDIQEPTEQKPRSSVR